MAATSPAQIRGPLSLPGDSHFDRVKPPEALFSEQIEASVGTGQSPVGPLWHTRPVRQPARVVGLLAQGFEVEHGVTGALEEDHVTQRSVVEDAVRVSRQPHLAAPPGEALVQHAARVAPHSLPYASRKESNESGSKSSCRT